MLVKTLVLLAVFTLAPTNGHLSSVQLATATGRISDFGTHTTMVIPLSMTIRNSDAGRHLTRSNLKETFRDAE